MRSYDSVLVSLSVDFLNHRNKVNLISYDKVHDSEMCFVQLLLWVLDKSAVEFQAFKFDKRQVSIPFDSLN